MGVCLRVLRAQAAWMHARDWCTGRGAACSQNHPAAPLPTAWFEQLCVVWTIVLLFVLGSVCGQMGPALRHAGPLPAPLPACLPAASEEDSQGSGQCQQGQQGTRGQAVGAGRGGGRGRYLWLLWHLFNNGLGRGGGCRGGCFNWHGCFSGLLSRGGGHQGWAGDGHRLRGGGRGRWHGRGRWGAGWAGGWRGASHNLRVGAVVDGGRGEDDLGVG